MARAHWHPRACKLCGTPDSDAHISQTGLCPDCGDTRMLDNYNQMRDRSGPHFRRWRQRIAASVGGVLLDDLHEQA